MSSTLPTRYRAGMVGGGNGAFIGRVHRMAMGLDGHIDLVCGAFSQNPVSSVNYGKECNLPEQRCYASYQDLLQQESALPEDQRMQFLVIVTPNASHFTIAQQALALGFHVFCEKPVTLSLTEALTLKKMAFERGLSFAVAYTYAGYPLVVEAKNLVAQGALGKIQKIVVDYTQGWLAQAYLPTEHKQADWRMDPARSGPSGCMGDIGVHAAHLSEFIGGSRVNSVLADLGIVGEGRLLDDDGMVLLRFDNGACGLLNASQICVGEENNLTIRVYGETGHLRWAQQEPDSLHVSLGQEPAKTLRSGQSYLSAESRTMARLPPGHPEGLIAALANLYRWFLEDMEAKCAEGAKGADPSTAARHPYLPDIEDGSYGMAFIEAVVANSAAGHQWTSASWRDKEGI